MLPIRIRRACFSVLVALVALGPLGAGRAAAEAGPGPWTAVQLALRDPAQLFLKERSVHGVRLSVILGVNLPVMNVKGGKENRLWIPCWEGERHRMHVLASTRC